MDQTDQKNRKNQIEAMEEQRRRRTELSEKFRSQTAPPPPQMTDGPGMMKPEYYGRGGWAEGMGMPQNMRGHAPESAGNRQVWVCACGAANTGKFCTECGVPGPKESHK